MVPSSSTKDLGEAMRRIGEGAAMIRLKGNAGTGNVLHAVRHARKVRIKCQVQSIVHTLAKPHTHTAINTMLIKLIATSRRCNNMHAMPINATLTIVHV